ncbi:hypothetical protein DUI87_04126 [Hirundo rustica rustica]|uniref:Uncharacterized protein n=1 Tax=Hirundo rustica rustica TaxID=333673 RepID=A0A3M0L6C4_HIRRU|nr:hypothetical protein DUI87_04126 [Hirundo rustica rustica]
MRREERRGEERRGEERRGEERRGEERRGEERRGEERRGEERRGEERRGEERRGLLFSYLKIEACSEERKFTETLNFSRSSFVTKGIEMPNVQPDRTGDTLFLSWAVAVAQRKIGPTSPPLDPSHYHWTFYRIIYIQTEAYLSLQKNLTGLLPTP